MQRFDDLGLHPLVIKIDVEGLELDVLQGMEGTLAEDEPLLLIEQNSSSASVAAWLEAQRLRSVGIRRRAPSAPRVGPQ